jgi:hypothetical protein
MSVPADYIICERAPGNYKHNFLGQMVFRRRRLTAIGFH